MRVRWFPVAGLCLSVAVWQGGIDASFGEQADRFLTSKSLPEKQLKESSNTAEIELVSSFPGRFVSFVPGNQGLVTEEFDSDLTRIFSLDGTELLSFADTSIRFAQNGQVMALMSPRAFGSALEEYTTRLMTLEGTEIARFSGVEPSSVTDTTDENMEIVFGVGPNFIPDAELLVTQAEQRSRLVNFAGEEIAVLEGLYYGLILGPGDIVTHSYTAGRYYLHDLNGTEIASFPGDIEGWVAMPDNQSVLVSQGEQTRWFDRNGVELATYPGHGSGALPDGQAIFLSSSYPEDSSRLVSLDGEEIASYTGRFPTLTPDNQRVVIRSFRDDTIRIYRLDGTEIAAIPGNFWEFSPDGKSIIVSSYGQDNPEEQKSRLYTLEGAEIATYMGTFKAFWPDSNIVVTSTSSRQPDTRTLFIETHLHSLEGELLATVVGSFGGISPNQELLAVSPNSSPRVTNLYRIRMGE
ncbi:MAG: WD40 repeat domain-containing protein [Cyanobacteria bacterium P01_C01_bin.70]